MSELDQLRARVRVLEGALRELFALAKHHGILTYSHEHRIDAALAGEPAAPLPKCVRCGAPYLPTGQCSRHAEGCQGGRGEASYAAPHPDTQRLDKLGALVINFRDPLLYGSADLGWYRPPVDEEGSPDGGPNLRDVIDALPASQPKGGRE